MYEKFYNDSDIKDFYNKKNQDTIYNYSLSNNFLTRFDFDTNHSNKTSNEKDEEEKYKDSNLNLSRFYLLIASFFYTITKVTLKLVNDSYPNYDYFLFSFFMHSAFASLAFFSLVFKKKKIPSFFNIQNKKSLLLRIFGSLIGVLFLKISFYFIRLGLAIALLMLYPILGNFLSILFLKEKFQWNYILGCISCFFGVFLISMGEKGGLENQQNNISLTFLGILCGLICSFCIAMTIVASINLLKKYVSYEISFLVGFLTSVICFFLSFLHYDEIYEYIEFKFIVLGFLNGTCHFTANIFYLMGLNLARYNKVSYISYMEIIFAMLFGFLFFGEELHLIDFIGGFMIIGYNYFASTYSK